MARETKDYWKEREKEWARTRRRFRIMLIIATLGVLMAAAGFLLEIFDVLKEGGLALGILGIVVTILMAIWGSQEIVIQIQGAREDIEKGFSLLLPEIRSIVRREIDRAIEEIRKI